MEIPGDAIGDKTLAILKDTDFHNGVIEATISGQPMANAGETARGFVGIGLWIGPETLGHFTDVKVTKED